MSIFTKTRYFLRVFGISQKEFDKYIYGKKGIEKQILAYLIMDFDCIFVKRVKAHGVIRKLNNVDYLELDNIDEYFGYKKYNIKNWHSQKRVLLRDCLLSIPVFYVDHVSCLVKTGHSLRKVVYRK